MIANAFASMVGADQHVIADADCERSLDIEICQINKTDVGAALESPVSKNGAVDRSVNPERLTAACLPAYLRCHRSDLVTAEPTALGERDAVADLSMTVFSRTPILSTSIRIREPGTK